MSVLRRTLTSDEPFDHEGEFYKFTGAYSSVKPATAKGIPLYFGGASGPALEAGAANADVYMLWGEPLAPLAERIAAVREASARLGREPHFSVSLRPIVEDTEAAAWARADRIGDAVEARRGNGGGVGGGANNTSVGAARLRAFQSEGQVQDERLWTRIAAGGNSTALVGTAEQVAESLIRYYDLGCTTILIRGFDPLEDAITYGRELIPRLRALVAERERARALEPALP
jgi:alkanesulfonate monooxygenase